jgi:hypothetical protein
MRITASIAMRVEGSPVRVCRRREKTRAQGSGGDGRMNTATRLLQIKDARSGRAVLRFTTAPLGA